MSNEFVKRAQRKKFFPDGFDLLDFEGVVTVNSNATSATVTTTKVKSDSNVQVTLLTAGVGSAFAVNVGSRVDATSFTVLMPADAAIEHSIGWAILG